MNQIQSAALRRCGKRRFRKAAEAPFRNLRFLPRNTDDPGPAMACIYNDVDNVWIII